MKKRVILQANSSGSPLRISVPGVDAAGAEFNDLIFDGNQPPLRLHTTSYVEVGPIDFTNTANLFNTVSSATIPSVPSGTTPIFIVTWRQPISTLSPAYNGTNAAGVMKTPQFNTSTSNLQGGGGGAISTVDGSGLKFIGLSTSREGPSGGRFGGNNLINFAVFKNYQ